MHAARQGLATPAAGTEVSPNDDMQMIYQLFFRARLHNRTLGGYHSRPLGQLMIHECVDVVFPKQE